MSFITRILIYDASYAVGFIILLTLNVFRCGRFNCSRQRAVFYSFYTFAGGLAGALLIGPVYNFLFSLKGVDIRVRVDVLGAVIFVSLFLLAAVCAEKLMLKKSDEKKSGGDAALPARTVSFRDTMDMVIPGSFFVFASIKLGCFFRGCCYGVESTWGITYNKGGATYFPVQIFECASICLILVICYFIKRTDFYRRGMSGPLAAFLYAVTRFLWEFKRYYTPEMRNFALGMTLWQIISIVAVIITAVWITVLLRTQPGEPLPKSRAQVSVEEFLFGADAKKKKGKNGNRKKK